MNLTNFLKQTDGLTAKYTAEQLASFIHDVARVLPEKHRADFLKRLKKADAAGQDTQEKRNSCSISAIDSAYEAIRKDFEAIEAGEVTISSEYNEEYDDWYGGEEFFYEDPEDIGRMLQTACDFIHTCMDMEEYEKGLEIGESFFMLQISCYSEYGDEDFSVRDMIRHDFLNCDLKNIALDTLYCGYHATPIKKRPETLYGIIVSAGEKELSLEALLQHGEEELPEFSEFLKVWIEYLGKQMGDVADRLFLEAVGLCNDIQEASSYAKKFAAIHPALYLELLEHPKETNPQKLAELGEKALKHIPENYIIRSRIALKTAEYRIAAKEDRESLKKYYMTAFESDTSEVNYLRAVLNGFDKAEDRKNLSRAMDKFELEKSTSWDFGESGSSSERTDNKPGRNTILSILFLDGQFDEVLTHGLNQRKALGWSGTFMKQGIAMFLLALHEGNWNGKGIRKMAETVKGTFGFSADEYRRGLDSDTALGLENAGTELFYNVFAQWKQLTPMEQELKERAIRQIEKLLEKRTAGIMEANRRNYYGECAAYIAALGEVKESLGDTGSKQRFMTFYKEKYSRRNAFRAEMKAYGWRG